MAESLEAVFKQYCSFGAGSAKKTDLDNKNWSKLCKDKKLVDKKLNTTEVDMIHTRCKEKGGRTLNFVQFQAALKQAAKAKYGNDEDPNYEKIKNVVCGGGGPKTTGTTTQSATGNVAGFTDASKYTGSHKERFDDSGKGKGKSGRVEEVSASGYVGNYKGEGSYDKK